MRAQEQTYKNTRANDKAQGQAINETRKEQLNRKEQSLATST